MPKPRKVFKTSPSVRIPKNVLAKLQSDVGELKASNTRLAKSVSAAARDNAIYVDALRDAVAFLDRFRNSEAGWTVADVKRLEEIRLLSLGV